MPVGFDDDAPTLMVTWGATGELRWGIASCSTATRNARATSMAPSRGVSGDYYQIVEREDQDELVVMIADVSGLFGDGVNIAARLEALAAPPIEVGYWRVENGNRSRRRPYQHKPHEKYATGLLVCLRPRDGTFTYCNAGHNPAILIRDDGRVERLGATGKPIGLVPGAEYEQRELELAAGDILVLYTDGFVEAENPEGDEYGLERFQRVFVDERRAPLPDIARLLEEDVRRFARGVPFHDDRTLVILRRTPSAP